MGNGSASANVLNYLRASYALDYRSLALFRILVALVVMADLAQRFQHSRIFYTDTGVLPRKDAIAGISQFRWSVLFTNGTTEFVNLVFVIGLLSAIAMLVGWRTRLATCLLWIIVISLQARNAHLSSGADTLMRVTLFWAMLLPLGNVWSVDDWNRSSSKVPISAGNRDKLFSSLATFGLIFQVSCVYLFTAIQKDGPRWREDGTALYFALGARDVSSLLGDWIFRQAPEQLLSMLTYGSLFFEFAIPVMLLLPLRSGWMRTMGVFLMVALHLGIGMAMTVGLFPAISIASAVGLLPKWFWDRMPTRLSLAAAFARYVKRLPTLELPKATPVFEADLQPALQTGETGHSGVTGGDALHFIHAPRHNRSQLVSLAGNTLAAFAIVLVLAWNIQTVSSYSTPPLMRQAAIGTGLYQNWSMFAPGPQTATIWFVVEGELASGEKIDLQAPIISDDVSMREPVVWDQSNDLILKDKYWRKYFHALRGRDTDSQRFAAYTCRTWNLENDGNDRLVSVTLTRGISSTRLDGERAEPKYDQMGSWDCR